jgi:DNA-binding NarL/FixJ family response regulator
MAVDMADCQTPTVRPRASEVVSMVERNSLQILLVEDSAVLADRLSELLNHIPGVVLVGTVDNERAAIAFAHAQPIDVMILDLHLRQGTGFGVLRALADQPRKTVAIVLTNYALPQYQRAASALGVRHFLDKAREFERIPEVLREIADASSAQAGAI